jgi:hypothetical protein
MGAPRSSRTAVVVTAIAVAAIFAGLTARHLLAARAKPPTVKAPAAGPGWIEPELVLHVPHAPGSITLDGDTDDPGWVGTPHPARTHAFLDPNGSPARPFSEIRMVWGDGYLYLSLYAADEDIESRTAEADGPLWLDDAFRVVFTQGDTDYAIEVSPRAVITDSIRHAGGKWDFTWSSGVHVSKEMDGSLNNPKDTDEEWVVEMAVPFESIDLQGRSGEKIGFAASRCDTPKRSARVCSSWGGVDAGGHVVLD